MMSNSNQRNTRLGVLGTQVRGWLGVKPTPNTSKTLMYTGDSRDLVRGLGVVRATTTYMHNLLNNHIKAELPSFQQMSWGA